MLPSTAPMKDLMPATLADELLIASTDLGRLRELLGDASGGLVGALGDAAAIAGAMPESEAARSLQAALRHAMRVMQFDDLAAQIISHVIGRLQGVTGMLVHQAWPEAGDEATPPELPVRPCPVGQAHMDAGSVELF